MRASLGNLYAGIVAVVRGRVYGRRMALSPDIVRWVRGHIVRAARAGDLARTYCFPHPLVHGRALVKAALEEGGLAWAINFTDRADRSLLLTPLARRVGPDRPLAGQPGRGMVAFNEEFFLQPRAQRRKIGTAVYVHEARLYARWHVAEIQLDAMDDGLVVWLKKGFRPQNPGLLALQFGAWARARGRPESAPKRAADYPEAFLRSLRWLALYKEVER